MMDQRYTLTRYMMLLGLLSVILLALWVTRGTRADSQNPWSPSGGMVFCVLSSIIFLGLNITYFSIQVHGVPRNLSRFGGPERLVNILHSIGFFIGLLHLGILELSALISSQWLDSMSQKLVTHLSFAYITFFGISLWSRKTGDRQ
jgi:hypothetical protein